MKNILLATVLILSSCASAQRLNNVTEKDGKIGIGTNQPDELLTVKGKIHTQEVLVDLEGAVAPDYVFERYFDGVSTLDPDYTFSSLTELEAFISENHHLPGVPSAATFREEGLALKSMNLILLEKIEELTLHTIEQQKLINNMQLQLNKLASEKE